MSTPNPSPQNPYAPPTAAVADVPDTTGPGELAERSSRLGAAIVDGLIVLVCYLPPLVVGFQHFVPARGVMNFINGGMAVAGILLAILIAITCVLVARNGQTIGKKLIGIKVVRSNGAKATLGRIFWLRNVANSSLAILSYVVRFTPGLGFLYTLFSGLNVVYGLVDILMIFGESRQCLHDKIADTVVVKA
jgi:uncharacterized RDD family membrane protein YckC